MSEFSEREVPLVPGALYGMRGFKADSSGKLHPLHRSSEVAIKPGENKAICSWAELLLNDGVFFPYSPEQILGPDGDWSEFVHPGARAPQLDCTCGWYGYFDNESRTKPFLTGGVKHVNAIVKATGRCIVGDLGFRAEKIEVVGLVINHADNAKTTFRQKLDSFLTDLSDRLPAVSNKYLVMFFVLHLTAAILNWQIGDKYEIFNFIGNSTMLLLWSYIIVQTACLITDVVHLKRALSKDVPLDTKKPDPVLCRKIKQQYPDVQTFSSLSEAKEHFTISKKSDLPQ